MAVSDDGSLKFVVFLGSTRVGRQGPRVSHHVVERLQQRGHEVKVLDPAELPSLESFHKPYHHYKEGEEVPAVLKEWAKTLEEADGYAIVACEYNHAPAPALLAAVDHFWRGQYLFKASAIVSYSFGAAGGARAAFVLRNVLGEVGLVTTPTITSLNLANAFEDDGATLNERSSGILEKTINELVWYSRSLKAGRASGLPY